MNLSAIGFASNLPALSAADLARAREYLYGALLWDVLAQLWLLAVLAVIYFSGFSTRLITVLRARFRSVWLTTALAAATFLALALLLLLPFDFYLGLVRERAFGFAHLGALAWLVEWGKSALVTLAAGVAVVSIAYAFLRRWCGRQARAWWLRLWLLIMVCAVFAVAVEPVFIEPLFNHFTPIADAAERTRITALAARAGIPARHVFEIDASRQSGHTNAYVVGILGSQRVVVYDTLLRAESPAEIDFVVGHELGHYVLHHVWKGLAFTAAYLLLLFFLLSRIFPRFARESYAEVAAAPLLVLILLALLYVTAPLPNGFSRWEEHRADAYGLQLTGEPCAAVQSFEREEQTDLIYPSPAKGVMWWFYNHPSQQERINFARAQGCPR